MSRLSWDEYFLAIMNATSLRASCNRGKSACVIVRDNRILATGYVGAPSGIPSCDETGHQFIRRFEQNVIDFDNTYIQYIGGIRFKVLLPETFSLHCIRTIHAEQNAIVNCARNGVSTLGATLYCTMVPCPICARIIIQAGIAKVIAQNKYQKDEESRTLFRQANIALKILSEKELY